jgi:hypothetical protein
MRHAHDNPINQALRRAVPLDEQRLTAAWDADPARQALLGEILSIPVPGAGRDAGAPARAGHRHRRRPLTLLVATAVALVTLTGGALASGLFSADPRDVRAVVDDRNAREAEMHVPGWRPQLDAETVMCVYGPGDTERGTSPASSGPIDAPLRAKDLIDTCAKGAGAHRFEPGSVKLCVTPWNQLAPNDPGHGMSGRYHLPVVLSASGSCEDAGFAQANTGSLLEDLNRRRAVEITLLAIVPKDLCKGRNEVIRLAKERVAALGEPLTITVKGPEDGGGCWGVEAVFWGAATVFIEPREERRER